MAEVAAEAADKGTITESVIKEGLLNSLKDFYYLNDKKKKKRF